MAQGSQTIQLAFTGGIDQQTAAQYVDPTTRLLSVINGTYAHDGAIEKRLGVAGLSSATTTGGNTGAPQKLGTRGAELLMTDGDSLYSYSPAASQWANRGLMPSCAATRTQLITSSTAVESITVAETGDLRAIVWRNVSGNADFGGDIFASIYDTTTGATIQSAVQLTTGGTYLAPLVIAQGSNFYLFFCDGSGNLFGQVFTASTLSWGSALKLVTDVLGGSIFGYSFDACAEVGGTGILLIYPQASGGGSSPRYLRFEALPALTITASAVLATYTSHVTFSVACDYNGPLGVVWFAWQNNAVYYAQPFNTSWSSLTTIFNPTLGVGGYSGGALAVMALTSSIAFFCAPGGSAQWTTSAHYIVGSQHIYDPVAYSTGGNDNHLAGVVSKPFRAQCGPTLRVFITISLWQEFAYEGLPAAATYYVLDCTGTGNPRVVATLAPRQADISYGAGIGLGDGRFTTVTGSWNASALTYRTIIATNSSEEFAPPTSSGNNAIVTTAFMDLAQYDFTPASNWTYAEGGGETFWSGGVPSVYDTQTVQELGFFMWPSGILYTQSTSGGSMAPGTYGYQFCFAVPDGAGFIHRSTFWSAQIVVPSGSSNNQVTFTIPNLPYTSHNNVVLLIFRTQGSVSGTTYYLNGSIPMGIGQSGSTTFVDQVADATIGTNALEYVTGGVLDSVNPPSFRHMVTHVERLWGIDDTGYVIWYSTPFSAADAPYFNEVLTLQFTDEQLIALGSMDDKLVVFGTRHIWFIEGAGPNNLGQNSDLTTAWLLPSDVGCMNPESVVAFPGGVLFQANSGGLYMLDRNMSVSYIGKTVQDMVNASTPVLGAGLTPTSNQVRFLVDGLSSPYVVTYDYVLSRWAQESYSVGSFGAMQTAITAGTTWTVGSQTGNVYQENSPLVSLAYMDSLGGSPEWVTMSLKTGHLKLAGLQGYQRTRIAQGYGAWFDGCDQTVTETFDYGVTSQTETFLYSTLSAANSTAAQWAMHTQATSGKAQAVQITWSDAPPTGSSPTTGQGMRMLGLAFEVQVLGDRFKRLPSTVKA
jgi:hypothetical protein